MSRSPLVTIGLLVALAAPAVVCGAGPADPLLRLAPRNAALTLVVEDLREHARQSLDTPLARDIRALPFVRDWLASERDGGFRRFRNRVESVLGADFPTVRDRLLGTAFVLTLHLPDGQNLNDARGLFLVRNPDRAMLDRLLDGLNRVMIRSGELTRVVEKSHNGTTYHVREFRPGGRLAECYVVLEGGDFAWSNSEGLVRAAIDRQAGVGGGLSDSEEFQGIRAKLSEGALATLYLDPRFAEKVLAASPRPEKPSDERGQVMLLRYVAAVRYAGAALRWQNGLLMDTEETLDPTKLPRALTLWAARPEPPDATLWRLPRSAVVMASAFVDVNAILEGLEATADPEDLAKFETSYQALEGLLLGLDFRSGVAPCLGPAVATYIEAKDDAEPGSRLPWVFSTNIGSSGTADRARAAVDNALRTFLALYSLDPKHGGGVRRVQTTTVEGFKVTALSTTSPFAYTIQDGRLVVGRDIGAVARALAAQADPDAGGRLGRLRSAFFPDAVSFAAADLKAVSTFASAHRPDIARRFAARHGQSLEEASLALDRARAIVNLFDAAFVTSEIAPDFVRIRRRIGLVRMTETRP